MYSLIFSLMALALFIVLLVNACWFRSKTCEPYILIGIIVTSTLTVVATTSLHAMLSSALATCAVDSALYTYQLQQDHSC